MGANTQMYYLNGRIDYTGIVTELRHSDGHHLLSPLNPHDKTGKVIIR